MVSLRYFKLWLSLLKNSVIRQTDYKANLIGRLLIEVVWMGTQILFFKSAFRLVPALAGWSEGEIWFFVGSMFFVDAMMMMLVHDNQNNFGQIIRLGQFDFYLLYPASSLFLANFRFVNAMSFINIGCAFALVIWASTFPDVHMTLLSWSVWLCYVFIGSGLVAMLGILLCSLSFWTTQSSNIVWLFYENLSTRTTTRKFVLAMATPPALHGVSGGVFHFDSGSAGTRTFVGLVVCLSLRILSHGFLLCRWVWETGCRCL